MLLFIKVLAIKSLLCYTFGMKNDTKTSLTQEETSRYTNLITSLVNTAVLQTEGIANELNDGKRKSKESLFSLGSRNIHAYVVGMSVTVDVYINVVFGFSVPQVACDLQEKIIASIKENTPLTPNAVNVNVSNAIFL